ncbi:hypothetical protein AAW01_04235 [Aurantiacibacter gangjinensis]|uniref:histidine kinase n=1 Tax=Aurantiacibacter gangjinensis TaxID=502682 RepID=A0A0G9MSK6_9SPHN|nr:hypothetical protein AAW01_04235 [Aurantiacibacter gangjinensis]
MDDSLRERLSELRIGSRELFLQATEQTRMAIVVVDPYDFDQPIAYVNRAFIEMTGYSREEAIGRNCRFLQGPDTDPDAVAEIRKALDAEKVSVVQLLNYRKDGTPFWNSLHIGPLYDADGKLAYFYGSQWDVTRRVEAQLDSEAQQRAAGELQHRLHNLFAVMSAIVRISARGQTTVDGLSDKIVARLEALGRAHRTTIGKGGTNAPATGLRNLVEMVLEPYRDAHAHGITLSGADVQLPSRMVTSVGVALHELATNAMKYGALGLRDGNVAISWTVNDDVLELVWSETKEGLSDAKPVPTAGNGSGSRIVEGVLRSLGGEIVTEIGEQSYTATITVPLPVDA